MKATPTDEEAAAIAAAFLRYAAARPPAPLGARDSRWRDAARHDVLPNVPRTWRE